mgnify:CR=1 FL=1
MPEGPAVGGVSGQPKNHGYLEYCEILRRLAAVQTFSDSILLDESQEISSRRKETPFYKAFQADSIWEQKGRISPVFKRIFTKRPRGPQQMKEWEATGVSLIQARHAWRNLRGLIEKAIRLHSNDKATWRQALPHGWRPPKDKTFSDLFRNPFHHLTKEDLEIQLSICGEHLLLIDVQSEPEELRTQVDLHAREPLLRGFFKLATESPPKLTIRVISKNDGKRRIEFARTRSAAGANTSSTLERLHSQDDPYLLTESTSIDPRFSLGGDTPTDQSIADTLIKLMESCYTRFAVATPWQNLEVDWFPRISPWPPSIDSFHLLWNIKRVQGFLSKFGVKSPKVISDIGCGTGILGLALADLNQGSVTNVFYTDNRERSPYLAEYNHERHPWRGKRPKATPLVGTHFSPFRSLYYGGASPVEKKLGELALQSDVIVCCPPYIPSSAQMLQTTHGAVDTGLLLELAAFPLFSSPNSALILLASSICDKEIGCLKEEIGRMGQLGRGRSRKLHHECVSRRWAPFRVPTLSDRSIENLVSNGRIVDLEGRPSLLGEQYLQARFPADSRDFRYWHQLQVHCFAVR